MSAPNLLRFVLAAAAVPTAVAGQSREADFIGAPGSSKPALSRSADGGLLLTWFEPRGEHTAALRIAKRSTAGRWSAPVTVAESDRFFVNWADFPSAVETADGSWLVHWLEKTEARSYAYHVRLSWSRDGGRTWSEPATAHRDRSPTEHGFVAMAPGPDGSVAVAWLDGGAMATDTAGSMMLRTASWRPDGTVGDEFALDRRTCECCQVAMARTAEGLVAVYRDRSDDEARDIAIVRQAGGSWTEPRPVHEDGWIWRACPVNGPSVDASGRNVAVAWYTAAGGTPATRVAFSSDAGRTFGPAIPVDDGRSLGRVQVRIPKPGSALVVWLEATGDEAEWRVRRIGSNGAKGRSVALARTERTREAGFSRAVVVGPDLFLGYAEPGPKGRVRVLRIPWSGIPAG